MEFEMIKSILAEMLSIDETILTMDTDLINSLGMHSLNMFDFMIRLEKAFEISLDIEVFVKMLCIKDVVAYIQQRKIYRG